jgi:hypothetical protein
MELILNTVMGISAERCYGLPIPGVTVMEGVSKTGQTFSKKRRER